MVLELARLLYDVIIYLPLWVEVTSLSTATATGLVPYSVPAHTHPLYEEEEETRREKRKKKEDTLS